MCPNVCSILQLTLAKEGWCALYLDIQTASFFGAKRHFVGKGGCKAVLVVKTLWTGKCCHAVWMPNNSHLAATHFAGFLRLWEDTVRDMFLFTGNHGAL